MENGTLVDCFITPDVLRWREIGRCPERSNETDEGSTETNMKILSIVWASLVAQMVKNLSAMRETWVQSLGWEDPLDEDMATHSNILA